MKVVVAVDSFNKRDPMQATTYGVGEMISDAIDRGCRDIIMGIDLVLNAVDLESELLDADIVVTGEGRLDEAMSKETAMANMRAASEQVFRLFRETSRTIR